MLAVLTQIQGVLIFTNGAFVVLGFFWACFLLWRFARISSFTEEKVFDTFLLTLIGALFFGRLVFILTHFQLFGLNLLKMILINGYPGFSAFGIGVGGLIALYVATSQYKLNFREYSDYIVSPVFFFLGMMKLGSFITASEPGIRVGGFRHPVNLYEAILFFFASFLCYKLLYSIRKGILKPGFGLLLGAYMYAPIYVCLDWLKEQRTAVHRTQLDYWGYAVLLLTLSFFIVYYFRVSIITRTKGIINLFSEHVKKTIKGFIGKGKKKTSAGKG